MNKFKHMLDTINLAHFNTLKRLFEYVNIPYVSTAYFNHGTKIYRILYSEDNIDACVNKDLFLQALEDLAIRYSL